MYKVKHLPGTMDKINVELDAWIFAILLPVHSDYLRASAVFRWHDQCQKAWFVILQGGRQLACDAETLFTVFQPYTFKPAAHFKELRDASLLLSLEPDAMHELVTTLRSSSPDIGKERLKQNGVLRLAPDQALSILEQRM